MNQDLETLEISYRTIVGGWWEETYINSDSENVKSQVQTRYWMDHNAAEFIFDVLVLCVTKGYDLT